jgi:hypothetical protein
MPVTESDSKLLILPFTMEPIRIREVEGRAVTNEQLLNSFDLRGEATELNSSSMEDQLDAPFADLVLRQI